MRTARSRHPSLESARPVELLLCVCLFLACGPAGGPGETPTAGAGPSSGSGGGSGNGASAGRAAGTGGAGGGAGSAVAGTAGSGATAGGARGGAAGVSAAAGAGAGGTQNFGGAGGTNSSAGASGALSAGMGGTAGGGGVDAGGRSGSAGSSTGGVTQAGGANTGGAGAGNAAGAGGGTAGPFVCNQFTGSKLSEEWYIAGFEDVVDDARWQVKWKEDAYLEEWANPASTFWNDSVIDSPCVNGKTAPDHIAFGVVSWKYKTQAEWRSAVTQTVNTFKSKYPSMLRMDLVTQIRGPANMLCPTAPTAGETIVVPPELDAALDEVAAAFPGFVFVGPKSVAHSCSEFQGGGPHLTPAGNMANYQPFATYFAQIQ